MKQLFNSENLFVLLTLVFSVFGLAVAAMIEKGDETLWFNNHHNRFADFVFKMFTHVGEIVFILPALIFIAWNKRIAHAAISATALISTGIVVQVLKRLIFEMMHRPAETIGKLHELRAIEGIELHHYQAFPSGHTAAAFALMFMFSALYKKSQLTCLFFFIATMTGISRIYLLQHFLSDVIAGALIGVLLAWIINRYFANKKFLTNNTQA